MYLLYYQAIIKWLISQKLGKLKLSKKAATTSL